ncbi:ATP-binding protein [Paraburkholderia caribensis]|uniref:ATP-binding protein n=1 Tax=Paraburkholderia caribensis TaxID=75105 RepID=UPI001D08F2A7|nr:ATP-binding protein [Paraburkholderia caribensis]
MLRSGKDHGCAGWRGEMALRIRDFDWSRTSLGLIDDWSSSLRAAVQLVLASPVPLVMLWGQAGHMVYNDAYAVFAGGRHPFLLGSPVEEGWPEIADFNRNVVDTCLAGGTLSYKDKELVLFRNGAAEDVWMDLYYSPVVEDDGAPAGVIAVVIETSERVIAERRQQEAEAALLKLTRNLEQRVADAVTARVELEEQLRQSQKMEAIGALTGGVAHDFNNVLQAISGNLQVLALQEKGNENVQKRVTAAASAVERGGKLSSQLLAFARRQPLSPTVINPGRIFDTLGDLLQRALGESISVQMSLSAHPWFIQADRNQLENAVLNLAINARDALDGEGQISVIGENVVLTASDVTGAEIAAGEYLRITVRDEGVGMSPEVLERACEPFFTTKGEGQGTGLGLSMVFGFVRQSGGHLTILSEVGRGTSVQMHFPRSAVAEGTLSEFSLASHVGGNEIILVVEDDASVRATSAELLRELGYEVVEAVNGDAALALLQSGVKVDLVLTDVVMPGAVKSADLAAWARSRTPPVPVLFTSGHTRDIISKNNILAPDVKLLRKPYLPETLSRMVRAVLAESTRPG